MTRRVGGAVRTSVSEVTQVNPPLVIRQARKEVPRSCQNLKRRLENNSPD